MEVVSSPNIVILYHRVPMNKMATFTVTRFMVENGHSSGTNFRQTTIIRLVIRLCIIKMKQTNLETLKKKNIMSAGEALFFPWLVRGMVPISISYIKL